MWPQTKPKPVQKKSFRFPHRSPTPLVRTPVGPDGFPVLMEPCSHPSQPRQESQTMWGRRARHQVTAAQKTGTHTCVRTHRHACGQAGKKAHMHMDRHYTHMHTHTDRHVHRHMAGTCSYMHTVCICRHMHTYTWAGICTHMSMGRNLHPYACTHAHNQAHALTHTGPGAVCAHPDTCVSQQELLLRTQVRQLMKLTQPLCGKRVPGAQTIPPGLY